MAVGVNMYRLYEDEEDDKLADVGGYSAGWFIAVMLSSKNNNSKSRCTHS